MATRSRADRDAGMVTVETAIALSAVILVLACCLVGIGCATAQVRCVDAAREAARLAARGDDAGAKTAVEKVGPAGATFTVTRSGSSVTVKVTVAPVGGLLPGVRLSATAVAAVEPEAVPSAPQEVSDAGD